MRIGKNACAAASLTAVLILFTTALFPTPAAAGGAARAATPQAFPVASVHFEQNVTDGDVEVVFEAKGGDEGLADLKIVAPDGRTVADFSAPDPSTLGIRQFRMESPEPKDVGALKAAYPEGTYRFTGHTRSGMTLTGTSTLSHRLPAVARFRAPAPEATGVPTRNVRISWHPAAGAAHYIVEIEHDELGTRVQATLPASATSFAIPDGFLLPGTEYELAIGTVGAAGNISFVETSFTTR